MIEVIEPATAEVMARVPQTGIEVGNLYYATEAR